MRQAPSLNAIQRIADLRRAGKLAEAERVCRMELTLQRENAALSLALGQILVDSDRFEEALSWLQRAERAGLRSAELYGALGRVYRTLDRFDEARRAFRRAIEIHPHDTEIWTSLGQTLSHEGQHLEAVLLLRDRALRQPHADNDFNYGQALVAAGRVEEAVGPLRRAVEWNDKSAPFRFALGRAYADVGRYAEAAETIRHGLDLDPNNAAGRAALAELGANEDT